MWLYTDRIMRDENKSAPLKVASNINLAENKAILLSIPHQSSSSRQYWRWARYRSATLFCNYVFMILFFFYYFADVSNVQPLDISIW